jgi:hypothetical protein
MEVEMERGVMQGGPFSGSIFNICQAPVVAKTKLDNPNVTILSIHDGHLILGNPDDVLKAFIDLSKYLSIAGYKINNAKSELFSFTDLNDEQYEGAHDLGLKVNGSEDGLMVAGSPIGTYEYEKKMCLKKVDEISKNLEKIRAIISVPTANTNCQIQTAYMLIRLCFPQQLNHILRSCQPSVTVDAATLLDKKLESFVFEMTQLLDTMDAPARELKNVVKRLHLAIRHGGGGINSCVTTRKAAYMGSIALCANHMGKLFPEFIFIDENCDVGNIAPSIIEYMDLVKELREVKIETKDFDIKIKFGKYLSRRYNKKSIKSCPS